MSLKKPITQTLVHVTFQSNGNIIFKLVNGVPQVSCSHQLFQEFHKASDSNTTIGVQVWDYSLKWIDQHLLIACAESVKHDFSISSDKAARKKALPVKLPFGIRRRKRHCKHPKKAAKAKAKISRKNTKPLQVDIGVPLPTSTGYTSADSTAQDDDDRSDDLESDTSSVASEPDLDAEAEPIIPISDTVIREESAANQLQQELEECDTAKNELAQAYKHQKESKTFFSKEVGLDHAAIAASGRSLCLHCKEKITKGTVRFAWNYNILRPHAWLHNYCLYEYVTTAGMTESTIPKLQNITQSASGSNDDGSIPSEAQKVLDLLQS